MTDIDLDFPEPMTPFMQPCRYKVAYGGRGGAKSWTVARLLVAIAASRKVRVLCCREFQKSIKDSVHKLLADQISELGLESRYVIQHNSIRSTIGSEFFFEGLKHNVNSIKSYEGINIVWVEEAHLVSKTSWDILIPTIRQDGSEIWITFNPELKEDETYQRFVVNPPKESIVIKINWHDNPWFPDVLHQEMEELRERDYDAYLNVWEGNCKEILEGAVFASEMRAAKLDNRITRVPYDPASPVDIYTDLGWSDYFSAWFVQHVGAEFRVIDFLQDNLKSPQHYGKQFQSKPYVYRCLNLPHDADHEQFAAGGRTVAMQFRAMGFKCKVIPRMPTKSVGINAARAVFPLCVFDEGRCADGLQSLRHYRYEVDPDTGRFSKDPAHDWASHGADAFIQLGLNIQKPVPGKRRARGPAQQAGTSWMAA